MALLRDGRCQQHQRQRTPRVAGSFQCGGGRLQHRCRGAEFAFGDQYVRQQHFTDGPARLLQLGEVGEPLGQLLSRRDVACQQQRRDLSQAHGEPQQPRMFGGRRPFGQPVNVAEPAHSCR